MIRRGDSQRKGKEIERLNREVEDLKEKNTKDYQDWEFRERYNKSIEATRRKKKVSINLTHENYGFMRENNLNISGFCDNEITKLRIGRR